MLGGELLLSNVYFYLEIGCLLLGFLALQVGFTELRIKGSKAQKELDEIQARYNALVIASAKQEKKLRNLK